MRSPKYLSSLFGILLCTCHAVTGTVAQESEPKADVAVAAPVIADEPKTIDPATLVPPPLAANASVTFANASLRDVLDWLRTEQQLTVLLETGALKEANISLVEPISDQLQDAPLYLLLNRLRVLGLAWYFEGNILHITSVAVADARRKTVPYNVGDLLDSGYELSELAEAIMRTIAPASWEDAGGDGAVSFLGDVMFIRQTDPVQRQVQGLLAALRKHARQTFILDPPQHVALRAKLEQQISVDFLDTPLEAAVADLARLTQTDVRLDVGALRSARIREREPVTLKLSDCALHIVLQAMFVDLKLNWVLRDGVLWLTTEQDANAFHKTAVYDVRDLCHNVAESEALMDAVQSQTEADWDDTGGVGSMASPQPGTLVVYHRESMLMDVLALLETYREALRSSKPRDRKVQDPQEVITVYYRLHAHMAQELATLLPKLVLPDTWKSETRPDAVGEVFHVASPPDLFTEDGRLARAIMDKDPASAQALVVARTVLIVRQTRAAHAEIAKLIGRVETGDPREGAPGGMGGGMGGMGGFF
ncbi:MAG: hypothetical protein MUF48_23040 [Pirellulaceae bacterium]|nr:hypothetical protein [Pirellulaceae bacterium]